MRTPIGADLALLQVGCKPEIHLFFERIYFGHLHDHIVAEADDAAGAAAYEMVARGFEDIKIILHGRERHQTAHSQARDIHKETKIPNVRNQGGIRSEEHTS